MPGFTPIPFPVLLRRMESEARRENAIYGLAASRWHIPRRDFDLSVVHFGARAANPAGPAAGPHTQLAQNIVLSWLAGGRFIELKTVQVNDSLDLPKPSIRIPNVGYNIEWSQELSIEESLAEYAKAVTLIAILRSNGAFGHFPDTASTDTIFDASLGYDLAGIRSPKVNAFLDGLQRPGPLFAALRKEIPDDLGDWRDVPLPDAIARTVTLSTFHGCPPGEIEAIVRYLVAERGLNVVVKLNPTLLGYEDARALLQDRLGYARLRLLPEAFDRDLRFEDAVGMLKRLSPFAMERGLGVGVKLTNTLVVGADPAFFPALPSAGSAGSMYLSGAPLHVLAMEIAARLEEALGDGVPMSFSAGVNASNFAATVAAGFVPVTSCTDLLKPPGYPRLAAQLSALQKEMANAGTATLGSFVKATRTDLRTLAARIAADPRYHSSRNARVQAKRDEALPVWDCLSCDLCVSVCPNAAIFSFPGAGATETEVAGARAERQLAVLADLCNECGNCEPFCPQIGSPYTTKPRVFLSRRAWEALPARDGWFHDGTSLFRRLGGTVTREDPSAEGWECRLIRQGVYGSGEVSWLSPGGPSA